MPGANGAPKHEAPGTLARRLNGWRAAHPLAWRRQMLYNVSRAGAAGSRWAPWSSKPVWGATSVPGGFDSHALPPTRHTTTWACGCRRTPIRPDALARAFFGLFLSCFVTTRVFAGVIGWYPGLDVNADIVDDFVSIYAYGALQTPQGEKHGSCLDQQAL